MLYLMATAAQNRKKTRRRRVHRSAEKLLASQEPINVEMYACHLRTLQMLFKC